MVGPEMRARATSTNKINAQIRHNGDWTGRRADRCSTTGVRSVFRTPFGSRTLGVAKNHSEAACGVGTAAPETPASHG
eukprot:15246181-Alexandrium_andersonii.AAC.1